MNLGTRNPRSGNLASAIFLVLMTASLLACGNCGKSGPAWDEAAPRPTLVDFEGPPLEGLPGPGHTIEVELSFDGVDLGEHFTIEDYELDFWFWVDDDQVSGKHHYDRAEKWEQATVERIGPTRFALTIVPEFADMCVDVDPWIIARFDGSVHDTWAVPMRRRFCFWGDVPAQIAEVPAVEVHMKVGERRPMALVPRWNGTLIDEEIPEGDFTFTPTEFAERPVMEAGSAELTLSGYLGIVEVEPGPVIVGRVAGEEWLTVEAKGEGHQFYSYQIRVVVEAGELTTEPEPGVHAVQHYPRYAGAGDRGPDGIGRAKVTALSLPRDPEERSRRERLEPDRPPMALFVATAFREHRDATYGRNNLLLARWTGSGFGFERVSQPWDHVDRAELVESGDRLFVVYSRVDPVAGLVIAERAIDGGPNDWQHQTLHPNHTTLDVSEPDERIDLMWGTNSGGTHALADFHAAPRDGGGLWIGLQHVLYVDNPELHNGTLRHVEVVRLIEYGDTVSFHDIASHREATLRSVAPEERLLRVLPPLSGGDLARVQTVFPRTDNVPRDAQIWQESGGAWAAQPASTEPVDEVDFDRRRQWLLLEAGSYFRVDDKEDNDIFGWLYWVEHLPEVREPLIPEAEPSLGPPVAGAGDDIWWLGHDGLFLLHDQTWTRVAGAQLPDGEPRALHVRDGTLWLLAGSAVYRSDDGATWALVADSGLEQPRAATMTDEGSVILAGYGATSLQWEVRVLLDPEVDVAFEEIALERQQIDADARDTRLVYDSAGAVHLLAVDGRVLRYVSVDTQTFEQVRPWGQVRFEHRGRTTSATYTAANAGLVAPGVITLFEHVERGGRFSALVNLETGNHAEGKLPDSWSPPLAPPVLLADGRLLMAHARWIPGTGWRASFATSVDGVNWTANDQIAPYGGTQQVVTGLALHQGRARVVIADDFEPSHARIDFEEAPVPLGDLGRQVSIVEPSAP